MNQKQSKNKKLVMPDTISTRKGEQRRKMSQLTRASYHLSRELGIPRAEMVRHVGVCASAAVKAIQKKESTNPRS